MRSNCCASGGTCLRNLPISQPVHVRIHTDNIQLPIPTPHFVHHVHPEHSLNVTPARAPHQGTTAHTRFVTQTSCPLAETQCGQTVQNRLENRFVVLKSVSNRPKSSFPSRFSPVRLPDTGIPQVLKPPCSSLLPIIQPYHHITLHDRLVLHDPCVFKGPPSPPTAHSSHQVYTCYFECCRSFWPYPCYDSTNMVMAVAAENKQLVHAMFMSCNKYLP